MILIRVNNGYPDYIGKRQAFVGYGSGPQSYVQLANGGDPISLERYDNYIDYLGPAITPDGLYLVQPVPAAANLGRTTWTNKWTVIATGLEAAAAANLSAENVILGGFCGTY